MHYCAEQLENAGSPVATMVKSVKRRDLQMVEDSYGDDVLNLVVADGYIASSSKTRA